MLLAKSDKQGPTNQFQNNNSYDDSTKRQEWNPEEELKERQQSKKPYTY